MQWDSKEYIWLFDIIRFFFLEKVKNIPSQLKDKKKIKFYGQVFEIYESQTNW